MEHLVIWPATVLAAFLIFIFFFRHSISNVISRLRLSKLGMAEFVQESEQQKTEVETKQLETARPDRLRLVSRSAPVDPLIAQQVDVLRIELDQRATAPSEREELLLQSVALWQYNHKHARTARFIFGSQVELLQELNAKPQGESVDHLKKYYDEAVQAFPDSYKNYSYGQYINFLEAQGLVLRIIDRVTLTPEGKAFLAYRVWTGDTMKKPN